VSLILEHGVVTALTASTTHVQTMIFWTYNTYVYKWNGTTLNFPKLMLSKVNC